jgi:hypothetical protein
MVEILCYADCVEDRKSILCVIGPWESQNMLKPSISVLHTRGQRGNSATRHPTRLQKPVKSHRSWFSRAQKVLLIVRSTAMMDTALRVVTLVWAGAVVVMGPDPSSDACVDGSISTTELCFVFLDLRATDRHDGHRVTCRHTGLGRRPWW